MNRESTIKWWIRMFPVFGSVFFAAFLLMSSSHREAPMIANDPHADNTDLYAFRSPDNADKIVIIANYIPAELPQGGPNYYSASEKTSGMRSILIIIFRRQGDDIIYRFTFKQTNQDPWTFFNIRVGKQNLMTTYNCERSIDGGTSWTTIITNGVVPPNNIGLRSLGTCWFECSGLQYNN